MLGGAFMDNVPIEKKPQARLLLDQEDQPRSTRTQPQILQIFSPKHL